MLTLAALVACVELLLSAWFSELRTSLSVFVPLIVSNLIIVQHLQASHVTLRSSRSDSLRIATGIAVTLLPLSVARELVGRGSLLHDAGKLFGGLGQLGGNQRVPGRHGISARDAAARRLHLASDCCSRPATGWLCGAAPFPAHEQEERSPQSSRGCKAANPEPTTELEYSTPFELLVAVILSAQATDKSVNLATRDVVQAREYAAGDRSRSASTACRGTSAPSACTTRRRRTSSRRAAS